MLPVVASWISGGAGWAERRTRILLVQWGDQRTKVDVLVGPDGGLGFGVQRSPQDQEGSHGRLTLRGPKLHCSRPGNRVLMSLAVS